MTRALSALDLKPIEAAALRVFEFGERDKRTGGNLRAGQEHLRHADIQTTAIYTRLGPQDLQKVVNLFDEPESNKKKLNSFMRWWA